jgi:hypothetical protein
LYYSSHYCIHTYCILVEGRSLILTTQNDIPYIVVYLKLHNIGQFHAIQVNTEGTTAEHPIVLESQNIKYAPAVDVSNNYHQ